MDHEHSGLWRLIGLVALGILLSWNASAQRIALLTPDGAVSSADFVGRLGSELEKSFEILDSSLSRSAYLSTAPATPFNLSTDQAQTIGRAIGCDLFVLVRSEVLRRSASGRSEYYESYAATYLVSTRTGRLVLWKLPRFEARKPDVANKMLYDSIPQLSDEITLAARNAIKMEVSEPELPPLEEPPAEDSPDAKNFRAPIPYRRIKPEYTGEAALYDITATVDIVVDLDAGGVIQRSRIVRWAGYGLDESVETTVRKMNWRPAERNGKTLPMRFLLRYNFKKVDKEKD